MFESLLSLRVDEESLEVVGDGVAGVLAGTGVKYIWMAEKGPGYGVAVPGLPGLVKPNGKMMYFGMDDAAMWGIGSAVAIAGALMKSMELVAVGVGFVLGDFLQKAVEFQSGTAVVTEAPATTGVQSQPMLNINGAVPRYGISVNPRKMGY